MQMRINAQPPVKRHPSQGESAHPASSTICRKPIWGLACPQVTAVCGCGVNLSAPHTSEEIGGPNTQHAHSGTVTLDVHARMLQLQRQRSSTDAMTCTDSKPCSSRIMLFCYSLPNHAQWVDSIPKRLHAKLAKPLRLENGCKCNQTHAPCKVLQQPAALLRHAQD